ncbi:MAG TPA: hypothetical protein VHZ77_07830 [Gaiellaceae bacterium]|nr:hypothetical protein [Gaiellaceae bacterium]
MKRALLAVVLATLAVAAPANATVPPVHGGSILGRNLPLKVFASISPPVHLFGDPITVRIAVVADRKWVAPANLRVVAHFAPYRPVAPPTEDRSSNGRLLQMSWTWTLRCLTVECIPQMPSSAFSHVFFFHPAHIEYLSPTGAVRYSLNARFQRVEVLSQLSPNEIHAIGAHTLIWQDQITPLPTAQYRVSPNLVFWLALALAVVLGAAGLAVAARWALQFRPSRSAQPLRSSSSLERALTLFFWARAHDDETLQRKALERVADELPFDVHDLSETARALAWSPEAPETEEVEEISERAGIHRRNGESDL